MLPKYRRGRSSRTWSSSCCWAWASISRCPFIGEADMLDVVRHANFFMLPFALAVETLSMLSICFLYYELQREGGASSLRAHVPHLHERLRLRTRGAGRQRRTFYLNYVEMRRGRPLAHHHRQGAHGRQPLLLGGHALPWSSPACWLHCSTRPVLRLQAGRPAHRFPLALSFSWPASC